MSQESEEKYGEYHENIAVDRLKLCAPVTHIDHVKGYRLDMRIYV